VFSFSRNKLAPKPVMEGRQWTAEDFFAKLLKTKAGDLMYSTAEQGAFVAASTRIADLGKHYLYEFDGKELTRPKVPYRTEGQEKIPGIIEGVSKLSGHCFLIETADGKAAVFRVISLGDRSARIQWVYQPDGSRTFAIPRGAVIVDKSATPRAPVVVKGGLTILTLDPRDFVKAIKVHQANRRKMVELSIKLISSKEARPYNRHLAAILLGQLRVVEGASVLAGHIDDDLATRSAEITVENSYRCVSALIQIGIPGASASLDQIAGDARSDHVKEAKEADQRRLKERIELRRNLLALVILRVHGNKLAKIVLEDRIAESADPRVKKAYQKALEAFPRVNRWLPEEKPTPTAPAATQAGRPGARLRPLSLPSR